MFHSTNVLFKGLVWKKKFWTMTRKYRAKELKKRLEVTDQHLRQPYFTVVSPSNEKSMTEKQLYKKINSKNTNNADIIDNYFNNLKNV